MRIRLSKFINVLWLLSVFNLLAFSLEAEISLVLEVKARQIRTVFEKRKKIIQFVFSLSVLIPMFIKASTAAIFRKSAGYVYTCHTDYLLLSGVCWKTASGSFTFCFESFTERNLACISWQLDNKEIGSKMLQYKIRLNFTVSPNVLTGWRKKCQLLMLDKAIASYMVNDIVRFIGDNGKQRYGYY